MLEADHIDENIANMTCCLSVGLTCEANVKHRKSMEDAHTIVGCFGGDSRRAFIGVYDGHGGVDASSHTAKSLHLHFLKELKLRPTSRIPEIFARAFVATDKELKELRMEQQGSTVVACYISPASPITEGVSSSPNSPLVLYTANAGDARAVLCRGGKAIRVSYDHKAKDQYESDRIHKSGGFIAMGRVNGILAVTRSLGDHALKEFVVPFPHTSEVPLSYADEFVIIACDGLWDVVSDQGAVDFVRGVLDGKEMSQKLVQKALDEGSTDNISVICLRFQEPR
eukprot:c19089_g2_i1.p1 GENE.c19089_g2_i1~~c19089_g2_i1.p1  ORF type:complete len:291 (-),score=104.28 c19089_g2_i1:96-944(-)